LCICSTGTVTAHVTGEINPHSAAIYRMKH